MSSTDVTTGLPTPGSTPVEINASQFDLAFPVVPLVDDPAPPTTTPRTNDLADFAQDSLPYQPPSALDVARDQDIQFDWDVNEPTGGWVSEEAYLVQWFGKALETPRGRFPIYDENYGSGVAALIGSGMPDPTFSSEVSRDVIRTGRFHPRILDVIVLGIHQEPRLSPYVMLIDVQLVLDTNESPITTTLRY